MCVHTQYEYLASYVSLSLNVPADKILHLSMFLDGE